MGAIKNMAITAYNVYAEARRNGGFTAPMSADEAENIVEALIFRGIDCDMDDIRPLLNAAQGDGTQVEIVIDKMKGRYGIYRYFDVYPIKA